MPDGVTPVTYRDRPSALDEIDAETKSRFWGRYFRSSLKDDSLNSTGVRTPAVSGLASDDSREWGKLPRRQLSLASRVENFRARAVDGHVVPTAVATRLGESVTAMREAIPLNRRLRNKPTRGQQARKGPEGPM